MPAEVVREHAKPLPPAASEGSVACAPGLVAASLTVKRDTSSPHEVPIST